MTNIPTDLLRTFVAVVDLRSFTKAASSLGVTQPAVSAQIKRLQFLLGDEIFDRSMPGISLTTHGELVLNYARRLLSLNDQIVHLNDTGQRPELTIRVGTPSDYIASILPATLASFRARWPGVRFSVRTDYFDPLARQLRDGELDVLIGLTMTPPHDARRYVTREVAWVRGKTTSFDPNGPVPLVSYGKPCMYHRLVERTLKTAEIEWEDVFTGPSLASLKGAVAAGLGIMAINRRRANGDGMLIWDDAPLPKLPDLYSGIYIREGGARAIYEQLADDIAAMALEPDVASDTMPGQVIGSIDGGRKKNSAA